MVSKGNQRGVPATSWISHHPENWDTTAVEEWITFTAEHFSFPEEIRRKSAKALKTCAGQQLLDMARSDFTSDFGDVGEIIFTALKQVLDVSPGYKGRSSLYASRIQALIDSYQTGLPIDYVGSFWKSLDVRDWFQPDIISWVNNIAKEYKMAPAVVARLGEQIGSMPGTQLYSMTMEDFRTLDSTYGDVLCRSLESLKIQDFHDRPRPDKPGRVRSELLTIKESPI